MRDFPRHVLLRILTASVSGVLCSCVGNAHRISTATTTVVRAAPVLFLFETLADVTPTSGVEKAHARPEGMRTGE